MPKTLRDLLETVPDVISITGDPDTPITAPVVESDADLEPGGLFVARRGLTADGHDFIPRAIERGAAAIVGERDITDLPIPYVRVGNAQESVGYLAAAYHDFPSRKLIVIGVTGTDGKTTTSTLIHSILQVATNNRAGLISTVAAYIGDEAIDTGFHVTTPNASQMQAFLAHMVENRLTHAVLEMTSHGLAQGRLNCVDIDVAVLTNLTHEHLDYHGTFEAYRNAKGRLFEMLLFRGRTKQRPRVAVINADDPSAQYFENIVVGHRWEDEWNYETGPAPWWWISRVILYGLSENANFRAKNIRYQSNGTYFDIEGSVNYYIELAGEFNVMNAMAAAAATSGLGLANEHIRNGLARIRSIPGRMERIDEGQDFIAIVDFAHTPNALKNALTAARKMVAEGGRLITVFGSAGLRDREKRRLMPEIAIGIADFTILTAEDPRTESLEDILKTMADAAVLAGGVEGETFIRIPDRGEALYRACQMAKAGDVVIACGKGHEQSMAFGTTEYAWDDRDAMRVALRGEPLRTLPTAAGDA
jgi:UDP-N-acetylmuramoyl-L-alanyl-D-glutamate--2,6-diaminopimelate ligase